MAENTSVIEVPINTDLLGEQDAINYREELSEMLNQVTAYADRPLEETDPVGMLLTTAQSENSSPITSAQILDRMSDIFRLLMGNNADNHAYIKMNEMMTNLIAMNNERGDNAPQTVEELMIMVQESVNIV